MLDLIPFGNLVIVKKFVVTKTKSGILMPSKDTVPLSEGRVVKCGPSVKRCKVGDLIVFGKNTGSDIERNGELYTLLYDSNVECKVDETINQASDNLVKEEI